MTKKHDPIDLAYLAGQIDADGCIGLFKQQVNKKTGMTYVNQSVQLTSQDTDMLGWVLETFGGAIYQQLKAGTKTVNLYRWRPEAPLADFLEEILPYLKTKKAQAQLILDYKATRGSRTEELRLDYMKRSQTLNGAWSKRMKEINVSE